MQSKTPDKVAKKVTRRSRVLKKSGKTLYSLTTKERIEDMRAFGNEQSQSKDLALSFLQKAGIATTGGKLAKPFRAA